jgi:mRNA-degrading endonuclease RelE of RelBE toxin-antitoxin system
MRAVLWWRWVLEECSGKWRVIIDPDVEEFFRRRGLLEELRKWAKELEEGLNQDPGVAARLLRERKLSGLVLGEQRVVLRRYRLWLGGVWWRLVFVVDATACEVLFLDVEKRDEETYKRLRRRLR